MSSLDCISSWILDRVLLLCVVCRLWNVSFHADHHLFLPQRVADLKIPELNQVFEIKLVTVVYLTISNHGMKRSSQASLSNCVYILCLHSWQPSHCWREREGVLYTPATRNQGLLVYNSTNDLDCTLVIHYVSKGRAQNFFFFYSLW